MNIYVLKYQTQDYLQCSQIFYAKIDKGHVAEIAILKTTMGCTKISKIQYHTSNQGNVKKRECSQAEKSYSLFLSFAAEMIRKAREYEG